MPVFSEFEFCFDEFKKRDVLNHIILRIISNLPSAESLSCQVNIDHFYSITE